MEQSIRKEKAWQVAWPFEHGFVIQKRGAFSSDRVLETDFGGDLEASWAATAEEGIANANIASGSEAEASQMTAVGADTIWSGVREKCGHQGADEVWMVKNVVGLKAQFKLHVLGDSSVFEDGKVKLAKTR